MPGLLLFRGLNVKGRLMDSSETSRIFEALETFRIEIPSWGFANTGTRFGKFSQPAAATNTEEKFSDAGEVHRVTGICPTRSEEHTSELQSHSDLVCRLL